MKPQKNPKIQQISERRKRQRLNIQPVDVLLIMNIMPVKKQRKPMLIKSLRKSKRVAMLRLPRMRKNGFLMPLRSNAIQYLRWLGKHSCFAGHRCFYGFYTLLCVNLLMYMKKNHTNSLYFQKKTLYLRDFDKKNRINHNKI